MSLVDILLSCVRLSRSQVIADEGGIEVKYKRKTERLSWSEIDLVSGIAFPQGLYSFQICAQEKKISVNWWHRGAAAAVRKMEVTLPDFPSDWGYILAQSAPIDEDLWTRPKSAVTTPETESK